MLDVLYFYIGKSSSYNCVTDNSKGIIVTIEISGAKLFIAKAGLRQTTTLLALLSLFIIPACCTSNCYMTRQKEFGFSKEVKGYEQSFALYQDDATYYLGWTQMISEKQELLIFKKSDAKATSSGENEIPLSGVGDLSKTATAIHFLRCATVEEGNAVVLQFYYDSSVIKFRIQENDDRIPWINRSEQVCWLTKPIYVPAFVVDAILSPVYVITFPLWYSYAVHGK